MATSFEVLATLAAAQVALNLSPGPNMVLIMHASAHDRRLGWAIAAGIWPVGLAWAALGLTGLGATLAALPELALVMRIACGAYLILLGAKSILGSFRSVAAVDAAPPPAWSLRRAFVAGIVSNVTNPKAIAYYMSIFTATGAYGLDAEGQAIAVAMMPSISFVWNLIMASVVGSRPVTALLGRGRGWFDRIAGSVMILFGARLLAGR